MPLESLNKLYDSVSKTYEIGDFNTFKTKMGNPDSRRKFYDKVSETHELGDFNTFEIKVSSSAPAINPQEVFVDLPDEPSEDLFKKSIYESVKQQENSVAKNNPYGVNLPRKKTNIEKIKNLGGSVMMGSRSLLEFQDMETGMRTGENIIDNILKKSKNDPATFYSNYSGLPKNSPEVSSFVNIFNKNFKPTEKQEGSRLSKLIKGLEVARDNPQYVLKAAGSKDPIGEFSKNSPQFVFGIPVSEIPGYAPAKKPKKDTRLTPKEIAKAQADLFYKEEMAKEVRKGFSERDAYRKVLRDVGGTSPNFINLAMDQSVMGSAFRIAGLDQQVDLSKYDATEFELIVSGIFSLLMPVDAALFAFGGGVGKAASETKKMGKIGDSLANFASRKLNIPIKQARVYAKNYLSRVLGGAGGFGAFDSGRNITEQIEITGTVDPIEALEHFGKGLITGGSVGFLGATGSLLGGKAGKAGEFVGEAFGLGTVPAVLEGEFPDITTKEGAIEAGKLYRDAAATIIGLKILKRHNKFQANNMIESVAGEIEKGVLTTGRPIHEVANRYGKELKTSYELFLEGKSPEKTARERIVEYEVSEGSKDPAKIKQLAENLRGQGLESTAESVEKGIFKIPTGRKGETLTFEKPTVLTTIESLKKQGFSQAEAEKRANIVLKDAGVKTEIEAPQVLNNRNQLESSIRQLSKKIIELEKSGAEQRILDDLQIQIDSKVSRLNRMGVEQAKIDAVLKPVDPRSSRIKVIKSLESKSTPSTKEVQLQMKRRSRSEQERLDKTLQERDFFNRKFEPDPMLEVPLHPADAGRKAVLEIQSLEKIQPESAKKTKTVPVANKKLTGIDSNNNPFDYNIKIGEEVYINESGYKGKVKRFKSGEEANIVVVESRGVEENLTDRNLFTPKKVYEENVRKKNLNRFEDLTGNTRAIAFRLQKELNSLDVTLKSNQDNINSGNLNNLQIQNLKKSSQRIKELQKEVRSRAESKGIELQSFLGIPSPRLLRQLFGSKKRGKTKYTDSEINKLYNNAMQRLDKDSPKEKIKIETTFDKTQIARDRNPLSRAVKWVSGDMIQRVEALGTPTSKEASQKARNSVDIEKRVYGEMSESLDVALIASGKPFFTNEGKAVRELSKFIKVKLDGKTVLMNRLQAGIEGLVPLGKYEARVVEKFRNLIEDRGRIFEENGIMQEGPDGKVRPFKVMGRQIAPRIMTGEFYRILQKGQSSSDFNLLVKEFQKSTGYPEETIKKYFGELSENINGITNTGMQSPTRTTQAEHSRKWKYIPHAIKINGELVPIVEYRPYEYARRLAETGSSRVGVAKTFGQEIDNTSIINKMKDQIAKENGDPLVFHEMIRSLSGTPVEAPFRDSGFTGSKASRGIQSGVSFIKNTTLSGSFFPNISEPLGNVRKHVGMPTLLKSIFQLSTKPSTVKKALELQGAITIDIANLSIDPLRPFSSSTRAVNEVVRRGFGFKQINEWQEFLAAQSYKNKVEEFQNGKGKSKNVILLEEMGYSKADAILMVGGKAPQSMYDGLVRRAPAYMTGGAQRGGEQSRLEHSKWFRAVTAFERYPQMKIRSLASAMNKYYNVGVKEAFLEKNHKKFIDANRLMASELLGGAVAGSTTQFILATIYGGTDNLQIKWNEVSKDPESLARFVFESWAYATVGGVFGSIIQSTAEGKLSENPWELSFPLSIASEAYKAYEGEKGKYAYLEAHERFYEMAKRYFPANKAIRTIAVASGFGNKQTLKDDNAIRAFYRWKNTNKYGGRYIGSPEKELEDFRKGMKKAYKFLREGEQWDQINYHVDNALELSGKDRVSAKRSILGKRLLTKSKIAPGLSDDTFEERKEDLRKTIGAEAFARLINHDEMLKDYAEYF
tara:strand:- start:1182 stop:6782 length:5601 start_codon:yes stop_codon:yes gene_type:complete